MNTLNIERNYIFCFQNVTYLNEFITVKRFVLVLRALEHYTHIEYVFSTKGKRNNESFDFFHQKVYLNVIRNNLKVELHTVKQLK